jgi:hypothetical protein
LVRKLDDAMGIDVVKSYVSEKLPPCQPDPVCEVIVGGYHGFGIACDSVLLYDFPKFWDKDLRQEFFLVTLRSGIGPFLNFPESISG